MTVCRKKEKRDRVLWDRESPSLHSGLTGENLEIGPKAGHKDGQRDRKRERESLHVSPGENLMDGFHPSRRKEEKKRKKTKIDRLER